MTQSMLGEPYKPPQIIQVAPAEPSPIRMSNAGFKIGDTVYFLPYEHIHEITAGEVIYYFSGSDGNEKVVVITESKGSVFIMPHDLVFKTKDSAKVLRQKRLMQKMADIVKQMEKDNE